MDTTKRLKPDSEDLSIYFRSNSFNQNSTNLSIQSSKEKHSSLHSSNRNFSSRGYKHLPKQFRSSHFSEYNPPSTQCLKYGSQSGKNRSRNSFDKENASSSLVQYHGSQEHFMLKSENSSTFLDIESARTDIQVKNDCESQFYTIDAEENSPHNIPIDLSTVKGTTIDFETRKNIVYFNRQTETKNKSSDYLNLYQVDSALLDVAAMESAIKDLTKRKEAVEQSNKVLSENKSMLQTAVPERNLKLGESSTLIKGMEDIEKYNNLFVEETVSPIVQKNFSQTFEKEGTWFSNPSSNMWESVPTSAVPTMNVLRPSTMDLYNVVPPNSATITPNQTFVPYHSITKAEDYTISTIEKTGSVVNTVSIENGYKQYEIKPAQNLNALLDTLIYSPPQLDDFTTDLSCCSTSALGRLPTSPAPQLSSLTSNFKTSIRQKVTTSRPITPHQLIPRQPQRIPKQLLPRPNSFVTIIMIPKYDQKSLLL